MTWANRYHLPDPNTWQGRPDVPTGTCVFQLIKPLDLNQSLVEHSSLAFALLGFCSDEGIRRNFGRTGAVEGPRVIREALAKLPLQKNIILYDAGDITCLDGDLEQAQAALAEAVNLLLQAKITPIILGGGHELAWGHFQGIAKTFPKETLGIVNFDAHFDMRPLLSENKGSSGTPFLQIAKAHEQDKREFNYNCIGIQLAGNIKSLFTTATDYKTNIILADDLHQGHEAKCRELIDAILQQNQYIYLSLCLDVFAAAYAPGVSAPQALGVTPWQIIPFIRQLATSGKIISYDIAEMSPTYDIDQRTAKLSAMLIFEIIHHHSYAY